MIYNNMNYYYKSQKYINKINFYGGINKKLPDNGIDIETYFILQGGEPIDILSLINNEYFL